MGGKSSASWRRGVRAWPFLLLLASLLIRGVTPAGWMPNPQGLAGSPFVICTADGAHLVSLHLDGDPAKRPPGERHDVCAFAGQHAAPAAQALLRLGSAQAEIAVLAQRPRTAPVSAERHRDQAPRAPPILV